MQKTVSWSQMKSFVQANGLSIISFKEHLFGPIYRYDLWASHNGIELNATLDTDLENPDFVDFMDNFYPTGTNY